MKLKIYSVILLMAAVSGCTTTKVQNVKHERGQLLKQEVSEPVYVSSSRKLSLTDNQVKLEQIANYETKEIKIYEKVQSTNLKKEGTTVTDSPFMAIIGTPGAILADIFTLGTVGFTSDMWVKDTHEWETVKEKLENDFIVDETSKRTYQSSPLGNAKVDVFINGVFVDTMMTDRSGMAYFDLANLLNSSDLHPKQFITNKGVNVEFRSSQAKTSKNISNRDIPENYFAIQFDKRRAELEGRKGRFENCSFIAKSKREFFECFYQS